MSKKLQVFVSSTYIDMRAERQAVVDAILLAGHIPAGMELFTTGDETQMETIKRWIDVSDVFMLVLSGRYGSVESKSKKSYIQLEYEYAQKQGKPYFAAVINDEFFNEKVKDQGRTAIEQDHPDKLKDFRTTVIARICEFFGDTKDLKLIVIRKLNELAARPELVGWVRASEVIDVKKTLEEMTTLQAENSRLRGQLETAQQNDNFAGVSLNEVARRLTESRVNLVPIVSKDPNITSQLKGRNPASISCLDLLLDNIDSLAAGTEGFVGLAEVLYSQVGKQLLRYGLVEYTSGLKRARCRLTAAGLRFVNQLELLRGPLNTNTDPPPVTGE